MYAAFRDGATSFAIVRRLALRGTLFACIAACLLFSAYTGCGLFFGTEEPLPPGVTQTAFGSFTRKTILVGDPIQFPTFTQPAYIRIGPDGKLYVTTYTGSLFVITLDGQNNVANLVEYKPFGNRLLSGLAFDPDATATNPVLYVTNNAPPLYGGPDVSGKISRIDNLATNATTDLIVGLPRSAENHMTFALEFGGDGRLYIAQGGSTNNGAPFPGAFGNRSEHPLSAAILVADVRDPGFSGISDVEVFASGMRNAYGLVFHSNGRFYVEDQGANVGFGGRPLPDGGQIDVPTNFPDEFNVLLPGRYYGHPNPARGQYAFRTNLSDGTPHQPALITFPQNSVVTGMTEYISNANQGRQQGNLLATGFVDDNIYFITLATDGLSVLTLGVLAGGFANPLDIAAGADGTIYVLEAGSTLGFGGTGSAAITVLDPNLSSAAPPQPPTLTPTTTQEPLGPLCSFCGIGCPTFLAACFLGLTIMRFTQKRRSL